MWQVAVMVLVGEPRAGCGSCVVYNRYECAARFVGQQGNSHESSALEAHRTAVRPSCFLSGAGRVLGWRPPAGWPCGPARCCGWLLSGVAVMRPCIVREKPTSTYLHILIKGGEGGVKQGTSGPADVS